MTAAPLGYDDPITLRRDGVYIGGTRVPGYLRSTVTVRTDEAPDHWYVDLTLMTGTEPVIDETGLVMTEHRSDGGHSSITYRRIGCEEPR